MKKLFVVIMIAFTMASCRRTIDQASVPSSVVTAFNQQYPAASDVEWKKKRGNYQAEFRHRGSDMEVLYSPGGTLLNIEQDGMVRDTQREIERDAERIEDDIFQEEQVFIPSDVLSAFNSRFPQATEVEWDEDNGNYEVEFMLGDRKMEATYRSDGTLVRLEEDEGIVRDIF